MLRHSVFTRRLRAIPYRAVVITERPFSPFFGLPHRSANALERWLGTLYAFSTDDWLRAARLANAQAELQRAAAREAVAEVITKHQLEVTAWLVRDMVATVACHSTSRGDVAARRVRRELGHARSLAEWAALAIATRTWLPPAHVGVLCDPFGAARTIPLSGSTIPDHRRMIQSIAGDRQSLSQAHGD